MNNWTLPTLHSTWQNLELRDRFLVCDVFHGGKEECVSEHLVSPAGQDSAEEAHFSLSHPEYSTVSSMTEGNE